MRFLFGTMLVNKMTFDCNRSNTADRPNTKELYHHLITASCPRNRTVPFFHGTHTAPMTVAHTMQELGFAVTRSFLLLFRQGSKQMGIKPQKYTDQSKNRLPDV